MGPGAAEAPVTDAGGETPERKLIDPTTVGSLIGSVLVKGDVPDPVYFNMVGDAFCTAHWKGNAPEESLLVSNGRLANAFVWIQNELSEIYEIPEPTGEVVVDQKGCLYAPRVVGVRTDQTLVYTSSDATLHNVHTKPTRNREKNVSLPTAGDRRELTLKRPEVMIEVVCDVHAWMKGWIGVLDHPFFAVSGVDGSWRIDGVPPGSYTLGVWHERLGQRAVSVTVGAKEAVEVPAVEFSAL